MEYEAHIVPHAGSANAAADFAVEPKRGVLVPAAAGAAAAAAASSASEEGAEAKASAGLGPNEIAVSYAPKTYAQRKAAELFVSTGSFTWRYKLVGAPPKYAPPAPAGAAKAAAAADAQSKSP